jgi:hypothetical protein
MNNHGIHLKRMLPFGWLVSENKFKEKYCIPGMSNSQPVCGGPL